MKSHETIAMTEAIRQTHVGIHGDDPVNVAQDWIDAGFAPETAQPWWDAYRFDAASAAKLRCAGIDPADAGRSHAALDGYTIGYWHSNNDISLECVRELIAGA